MLLKRFGFRRRHSAQSRKQSKGDSHGCNHFRLSRLARQGVRGPQQGSDVRSARAKIIMNLETACRELVERGRLGDQNAIATMAKVTENAKKGDPKAQKSHDIMLRYARYTENDKPARGPEITGPLQTALASLRDGIRKVRNKLDYVKHVRLTVPQVGVSF